MHPYARILHFGLLKTHKQTFCISWRTLTRLLAEISRSWPQIADRGHTSPSSQNVESLNAPFALRPPQTLHHYIVRSPMGPTHFCPHNLQPDPRMPKKCIQAPASALHNSLLLHHFVTELNRTNPTRDSQCYEKCWFENVRFASTHVHSNNMLTSSERNWPQVEICAWFAWPATHFTHSTHCSTMIVQ